SSVPIAGICLPCDSPLSSGPLSRWIRKERRTMTSVIDHPDYFLLDADLTDADRALRDRVRAFGQASIEPIINDYWERAEFPREVIPGLRDLGIIGTFIKGYDCPGFSRQAAGIVAREMGRIDGSVNTFLGV